VRLNDKRNNVKEGKKENSANNFLKNKRALTREQLGFIGLMFDSKCVL